MSIEIVEKVKEDIEAVETFGKKTLDYLNRHWYWYIITAIVITAMFYAFGYYNASQNEMSSQAMIQTAISDDKGLPWPGKEHEFFQAQTKIQEARHRETLPKTTILISSGFVCAFLILITSALLAHGFTPFKFLQYIRLMNKDNLTELEKLKAKKAFIGLMIILVITSLLWIPLDIIFNIYICI